MITPDELKRKAQNQFPKFVSTWIRGGAFFPLDIPFNRKLSDDIAEAATQRRQLRGASREVVGHGYHVDWVEKNTRRHARIEVPERISFPTRDDFLQFIDKRQEFGLIEAGAALLRTRLPELETWLTTSTHWRKLVEYGDVLDSLVTVAEYLREHPRPDCFARELPLEVDTKFVERHEAILRPWLNILLPPHAIRHAETKFTRRFFLRSKEPFVPVRLLDEELVQSAGLPFADFGLTPTEFARWKPPESRVLIVENEVPLLTLPPLPNTLAVGKLGNAAVLLRDLPWIAERDVLYWGDLDVPGFEILNRFRRDVPQVRSLLMDEQTLVRFRRSLGQPWKAKPEDRSLFPSMPLLTPAEATAARTCFEDNLRIEQERIPFAETVQSLKHLLTK